MFLQTAVGGLISINKISRQVNRFDFVAFKHHRKPNWQTHKIWDPKSKLLYNMHTNRKNLQRTIHKTSHKGYLNSWRTKIEQLDIEGVFDTTRKNLQIGKSIRYCIAEQSITFTTTRGYRCGSLSSVVVEGDEKMVLKFQIT